MTTEKAPSDPKAEPEPDLVKSNDETTHHQASGDNDTHQDGKKTELSSSVQDPSSHPYDLQAGIFTTMYAVAMILDGVEGLTDPDYNATFGVLIATYVYTDYQPLWYMAFLVYYSYYLWTYFPDLANHSNLALFVNAQQLLMYAYVVVVKYKGRNLPKGGGEWFELMRPVLAVDASLTYFFAGFHKLNWDFLDPRGSCTRDFMYRRMPGLFGSKPSYAFIHFMNFMTLAWEMGGAVALFFQWGQPIALLYSIKMHMVLCPISFYDFSSMMMSIFFVFVPDSYFEIYRQNQTFEPLTGWKVKRHNFYYTIPLLVALIVYLFGSYKTTQLFAGLCYIGFFGVLLEPLVQALRAGTLPPWTKPFAHEFRPRWMLLTHACMIFFAMNNYLGLRTGGTFSMFSNLTTEGPRSNHILLGSNPFKLFGFQEDIVKVIDCDSRFRKRGKRLAGYALPLVEMQSDWIFEWQYPLKKDPIWATLEYRGVVYEADDVSQLDVDWLPRTANWRHKLLQFRPIPMEADYIKCAW